MASPVAPGKLAPTSPELKRRLLSEGVPKTDVRVVAAELSRCVELARVGHGDRDGFIVVEAWTAEILTRFGDKVRTLFMAARGRVDAR